MFRQRDEALFVFDSRTRSSPSARLHARGAYCKVGLLAGIGAGLGEVRSRTWLWVWTVHGGLINLFVISPIFVLGPYIAERHLGGAAAWAGIGIGFTAGSLAGGLVSSR